MTKYDDNQFLILFSCCICVEGYTRSIIVDFQRDRVEFIPNTMVEIIEKSKSSSILDIYQEYDEDHVILDDYINFLLKNEYAFWGNSDERGNFPQLSKSWDFPSMIANSIVDINQDSSFNIFDVIKKLDTVRCFHVEFRFFSVKLGGDVINILKYASDLSFRSIEVLLPYDVYLNLTNEFDLRKEFPKITSITIHNSPEGVSSNDSNIRHISRVITDCSSCGVVSSEFFSTSIKHISESKLFNSCLNRKVSIDVNGNVKNCPSLDASYGNIEVVDLKEVVEGSEFRKYWHIRKDEIQVCKDCEFRHICTDCRAYTDNPNDLYSHPSKCSYNPYQGKWEGEANYKPIKEYSDLEISKLKEK